MEKVLRLENSAAKLVGVVLDHFSKADMGGVLQEVFEFHAKFRLRSEDVWIEDS